ncbi:tetratricopeptide repeat protein [Microcoleus sp. w1-18aA5]|uniref:tetratricopeptide repeat protein n=1 Tax=Microcoleus sp. w1-18aA5 TaxID=2818982 RepID=UPI002FCFCAD4
MNAEKTAVTHIHEGDHFLESGNLDEAIAAYRHAIELNPDISWSYHQLGQALTQQGKLEEAIAAYHRAIELNPDLSGSHHNLGESLVKLGQFEEAIAAFRRSIELKPDFSWSYHHLGDALAQQLQPEEAAAAFRKAIELNRQHFGSYCGLGQNLVKLGRLDEAIVAYEQAIKLNPDADWIHYRLGEVLQQRTLLDLEGAIVSYRRAIELNPDDVQAYRKLLEIQPDNWEVWLQLGKLLIKLEQGEEAITSYRRACQLNPESFEAHFQLGKTYLSTKFHLASLLFDSNYEQTIVNKLQQNNPPEVEPNRSKNDEEFVQVTKHLSNEDFIIEVYRVYLKRHPAPVEVQHWNNAICKGCIRLGLVNNFTQSPEYKHKSSSSLLLEQEIAYWRYMENFFEEIEDVTTIFRRAVELNQNSYEAHYYLAKLLKKQRYHNEANVVCRQIIKLGTLLGHENKMDLAIDCYQKAVEIENLDRQMILEANDLAILLIKLGQIQVVLDCYQNSFKNISDGRKYFYNIASQLSQLGLMNEAVIFFEQALQTQIDKSYLYESLWKGLNQLDTLDKTNPNYSIEISLQEVDEYFRETSKYKVINIGALAEEDINFLQRARLPVINLHLIANQQDCFTEQIYAHKFGFHKVSQPEKIKPPVFPYEKNIVETGYIYCVCPFSGEILRSNQSFLIPGSHREVFAYRFVGKEVFYLLTGCQRGDKIGIYIPNLDMLIRFGGEASLYVGTQNINHLKAYLVSCWSSVKSYLSSPRRKMTLVVGFHTNIGHHIWDELTGIEYLCKREIVDNYDFFVGGYEYFSIEHLFPEIPLNSITHYDDVIPHQDTYSVFKTIVEKNHFVFRLGTGFMDDNLFNRIKRSSIQRCSQEFLKQVKEIQERHFPVILIQIRAHSRIWLNQVEGIASIINNLYLDYPNLAVVFDGWSLTGKEDASSGSWSAIEKEKKLMAEILDMIPSDLKVYSSIGSTVDETVAWTLNVDLHISPLGAGTTFTAWIAHKPGVLHAHTKGIAAWGKMYLNQQNHPHIETFQSQVLIPDDSVENFENFNYKCDWRAIYNEVIKIIKELRK